jgi:hypothetical protein
MVLDKRNKRIIQNTALDLLKIYFILKDLVKDGFYLLDSIGEKPAETIKNLSFDDAKLTLEEWDQIVRRQGSRLSSLKEKLLDQDVLSVVDPSLKSRLAELVSSKFDRVGSLHHIGAVVFFYSVFGTLHKEKQLIHVIRPIYHTQEDGDINILKAREEVNLLKEALDGYRLSCYQLIDNKEKRTLTKKARDNTRLIS